MIEDRSGKEPRNNPLNLKVSSVHGESLDSASLPCDAAKPTQVNREHAASDLYQYLEQLSAGRPINVFVSNLVASHLRETIQSAATVGDRAAALVSELVNCPPVFTSQEFLHCASIAGFDRPTAIELGAELAAKKWLHTFRRDDQSGETVHMVDPLLRLAVWYERTGTLEPARLEEWSVADCDLWRLTTRPHDGLSSYEM